MGDPASDAAHLARNAVDCLPAGGLEARLAAAAREGRPLRVKLGLDPTAPDIHLGHTVVLQKLREFQDLGHRVVLIVGDYTARVGDPSGRSSTRPVLSGGEIDANAETYKAQAFRVLLDDPDRLEIRFNGEWLDMPMEDLFALARTTTVAQLLEREDFARRFAATQPISILELLYPLMQGYDSVAVRADVELGGTDQTFNLLLGRDVQRAYGQPEQVVLTVPLLPGIDGQEKMSKSVGNHIGVTDAPEEMYGRTLRLPDDALATWYDLLLGTAPAGNPRDAKRALARALVDRFHGPGAGETAEEHFDRVFVRHEAPESMPDVVVGAGAVHVPAVLAEAFGVSRSRPAGSWPRAGCASTASPWARRTSTWTPTGSTGGSCSSENGASRGSARTRPGTEPGRSYTRQDDGADAPPGLSESRSGVLSCSVRTRRCSQLVSALLEGVPLLEAARRSLKTQQHALLRALAGPEECRSDSASSPARGREPKNYPVIDRGRHGVLGSPTWSVTALRDGRRPSGSRPAVLHGEFDPGSGRTLAACLTHASGATNQGLPWGRAANG